MLKRSKAISIVLAFIFCMSFMAPAFVAPDVAQASCTYEVLQARSVKADNTTQPLGIIKVKMDDTHLLSNSILTVSLPSDLKFPNQVNEMVYATNSPDNDKIEIVTGTSGDIVSEGFFDPAGFKIESNNFDIKTAANIPTGDVGADKYFYIYFNGVNLNNTSGDIEVRFSAPSGSGFSSSGPLVIAKSTSSGATTTTLKKVRDITDSDGSIDSITIVEDRKGSINFGKGKNITLEILTNGFEWNSMAGSAEFGWSLSGTSSVTRDSDKQKMILDLGNSTITGLDASKKSTSEGKITISGLKIDIDDSKADPGDEVEVKVSGADMTSATFVVAKYVDYDVAVEEGTTKTLIAGQGDQKLGEFYIKEGAAGSLVGGRTIKFTLPSGVEWKDKGSKQANIDKEITNSSSIEFKDDYKISGDDDQILTLTIKDDGSKKATEGAKIKFKDFKVNVSPAFTGDIELEVSGSAGATGTVKVAEVVPAARISVDKVNNIILGKANQKVADITLTEGDVEGLLEGDLVLKFDRDYRWSKEPTVKVTEGNLDIDKDVSIDNEKLTIKVTGQSSKNASTILISDIYVDAYRTAPEGPISLEFEKGCSALFEADKMNGYTTGSDSKPSFKDKSAGKAVVANCVTAAMGETIGNGQFVIGSNIYEMNGVKKVMDAAPYVKNDRTYVPVRYLGYVLGLTDDDIVWDQAAQKVTFTKGDNTVELVIGSTTITVNGEEQVMDVAPEISSDRTMLPARYVAEAFGFNVGWDAINQIVLISK